MQLLKNGSVVGEIREYDLYKTQSRCTFRINQTVGQNEKYELKSADGNSIKVTVTSDSEGLVDWRLVHAALDSEKVSA